VGKEVEKKRGEGKRQTSRLAVFPLGGEEKRERGEKRKKEKEEKGKKGEGASH